MDSSDVDRADTDTELDGDVVSEDGVVGTKTVPELSVRESGLDVEDEDEDDMEVDFVQSTGLGTGSDDLGAGNGDEDDDLGTGLKPSESLDVDDVANEGSLGKTSFNSSAQHLFPKTVNEGAVSKEVRAFGSDKVVDLGSSVVSHEGKTGKKGGFRTSDLVWGKVRSHPWWPAQIFDVKDASEQAKKHFKSKGYLLAYFGDQTFAWNEKAKLKPFEPHFSQMAKQSTAEAFQDAVNCALDEAGRRAEFGLSCQCVADDVYSRLKIQVISNAGIREKMSVREERDRLYTPTTFEPVNFLGYVLKLAESPHVEGGARLEHVVAHAQMSAFYRWKGCYHLAEFGPLIGYVNNEADAPVSREKEAVPQMSGDANASPEEKTDDDSRPLKRKKLSGNRGNSAKKGKRSTVSVRKKRKKYASEEDESESDESEADESEDSEEKTGRKLVSSSPKSRKVAKMSNKASKVKESRPKITPPRDSKSGLRVAKMSYKESKVKESSPQITTPRDSKSGLRVGESILRAALQLSQPSPLLKMDVSSHGKVTKDNDKSKQRRKQTETTPFEKSSPDAILTKFLFVAVNPLKEYSFLGSMISFISDFRDSLAPDIVFVEKPGKSVSYDIIAKSEEIPSGSGSEEMVDGSSSGSESKEMGSACDMTTASSFKKVENENFVKVTELQTSMADEEMVPVDPELTKADGISTTVLETDSSVSESQQLRGSENIPAEGGLLSDKDPLQEESPTALTLKFTDMDSIPTEDKLNSIFSAFGPLKESETEVLKKKNCARVVFKRRVDADTAFSSSGKFETFGSSLVCYQLNYTPLLRKSPSPEAKRRRKDGTLEEAITA